MANISKYTLTLMLLTASIMIIVFCIFFKKLFPERIYPLALFSISFFLLVGTSLVSNYLLGADVNIETYFATLTYNNSFWDTTISYVNSSMPSVTAYNGMLSVTVLPVIFSKFMNFSIDWIFKLVYPLIYALVPLGLYLVYRKQTNPIVAFLAVFLFMSMDTFFLQMLGLGRQMIAEVFLVLLVLLFVEGDLRTNQKRCLFIVFSVGLVVSHYSLAYLFAFFLLLFLLVGRFLDRPENKSAFVIKPVTVIALIITILTWNFLIAPEAFQTLITFATRISSSFLEFTQGPQIVNLMPVYLSPLHDISKYIFFMVQGLVILGFIGLLISRKKRFSPEYSVMCLGSLLVLLMALFIPSFAMVGLNETRFYHLSLFFISPLCITGMMFFVGLIMKPKLKIFPPKISSRVLRKKVKVVCLIFVTVLIVSFFAFQVGFVYEVTGDVPTSISLSMDRCDNWTLYLNQLYITPQEVVASKWLGVYRDNKAVVYGDSGSKYLISYGLIDPGNVSFLDPSIQNSTSFPNYYFFGTFNLKDNKVAGWNGIWNLSEFSFIQDNADQIYSNGGSDIFFMK